MLGTSWGQAWPNIFRNELCQRLVAECLGLPRGLEKILRGALFPSGGNCWVPRGWRPVKMHTNEHPVPQTIGKMQVVGSKLCKRAERGCNLSKRFMSRGGAAPPHLALAEIATPLSSFAQFAANHLHFTDGLWDRVLVCMHFYGSPPSREQFPPLGNSSSGPG